MTTLSPNDSAIPPDQGVTATVTISKIVGPDQVVIGEGQVTYLKTLTADGTSAPSIALRLRDGLTPVDDNVQSTGLGRWFSTVTLSKFKRYSLSIIEKNPPGDFSYPPKTFVLATATPLIATVTGKDGPIENGGSYNGNSLEFTGNAPPGVEVEAFDDGNTLGKTATVDRDGFFKITLDGLVRKIYKFTFKAPDGKESEIFTVIVGEETATTIDDVQDDEGNSVPEGKSTIENNLTVSGTAQKNVTVTVSGGVPTPVEAEADENGAWKHRFVGLASNPYSLTADSAGTPLAPSKPRTFTVRAAVKAEITTITNEAGIDIPEGETTSERFLIVNCTGEKGKELEAFDGLTSLGKDVVGNDGTCKIRTNRLTDKSYAVTVKGLYTGGGESDPYPFTVDGIKSLDGVQDDEGNSVPDGGSTIENNLTVTGTAEAGVIVTLSGGVPTPVEFEADENGDWTHRFAGLAPNTYSLTADSSGIRLAPTQPRTFTVRAAVKAEITTITNAAGIDIPEGETTSERFLIVNCTGEKGKELEAFDGLTSLGKDTVGNDEKCKIDIGPLTDKPYAVKVRGLYTGGGESRTYSFTVATPNPSEITLAIGENNQQIENGGSTRSEWLVIRGKTVAGQVTKLLGAPVPPQDDPANAEGVCIYFLSPLSPATYSFTIQKSDGSTPPSPAYVVTILP